MPEERSPDTASGRGRSIFLVFVGRVAALALGDVLVADVVRGRGHVLLVAGEAGIGRTSLARELLRWAEAAGAVPHWGGCFDGACLLPYGVYSDPNAATTFLPIHEAGFTRAAVR